MLVFGYARPAGGGGSLKDTEAFRSWLLGLLATHTSSASSDDYDSPKGHLSESHHQFEFVSRCHFAPGQFGDVDSTRLLLDMIECEEGRRRIARRATESARRTGLKWLERTKANKAGSLGLTMMTTSTNGNHAAGCCCRGGEASCCIAYVLSLRPSIPIRADLLRAYEGEGYAE